MRDDEVINENLRHTLASFARVREAGEVACTPGLSLVYSGSPYGLFNTGLLLNGADFEGQLRRVEAFFEGKSKEWSVWLCESFFRAEERRQNKILLATLGFKQMMDTPGMIAEGLARPRVSLPRLECRRVASTKTMADFSQIMSAAFHVPDDMARDVYGSPSFWDGTMTGWVGYFRGQPVSTVGVVPGGGVLGVYAVATHPLHQRKGYAEALMRHAVVEARSESGLERVVLQSSAAGYQLYLRMGFRNVTRFLVYLKGE